MMMTANKKYNAALAMSCRSYDPQSYDGEFKLGHRHPTVTISQFSGKLLTSSQ